MGNIFYYVVVVLDICMAFCVCIRDDPIRQSRAVYEQYGDTKGEEIYQDLCSLQAVNALEVGMFNSTA